MEARIDIDSEIPRAHPNKAEIERALRRLLVARGGMWRVWVHVRRLDPVWYVEATEARSDTHLRLLVAGEDQEGERIAGRVGAALFGPPPPVARATGAA